MMVLVVLMIAATFTFITVSIPITTHSYKRDNNKHNSTDNNNNNSSNNNNNDIDENNRNSTLTKL